MKFSGDQTDVSALVKYAQSLETENERLRAALTDALDLIRERVNGRGFTQGQVAHDNFELGNRIRTIRAALGDQQTGEGK